ncbi:hypothetical protein ACFWPH_34430 [Nocardia sp. NPDC058499]|uniref:hypothetical protein n=1 Tax=Nocardia sp. NPDC058499 TaxID=3346530 RepID=UPI003660D917
MTQKQSRAIGQGVYALSAARRGLAAGQTGTAPGTISVLSTTGGVHGIPREGNLIEFGRNIEQVHVGIGQDDLRISRVHGTLSYRSDCWQLGNAGRVPLRLPESRMLFEGEEPLPLPPGYTPVFLRGSHHREYLLEIYVTGDDEARRAPRHEYLTDRPPPWPLEPDEKLALVALGQAYLYHERWPQPWTWNDTAGLLAALQPQAGWTGRRVAELAGRVRSRMSDEKYARSCGREPVPGLTRDQLCEPIGNMLNHNLLQELTRSATLVPRDLDLLD